MNRKKKIEEEYVISDREKRAWAANKKRGHHKRPVLDRLQRIHFLKLIARMASRLTFERELNLNASDIQFYKKELDIESQDEARRLVRRLQKDDQAANEARIIAETQKARDAEVIANQRLDELNMKKSNDLNNKTRQVDSTKIKQEDAERQRRFAAKQSELEKPKKEWRLPMETGAGSQKEQVDRFRRDIIYHGLTFLRRKYSATSSQVKFEATRLGLRINWEIVRK